MIEPGPVSMMLEAELREQARQHGVIMSLDKDGAKSIGVGWALCTQFAHDLRRAPRDEWLLQLRVLPRPGIAACQKLAGHLRARHPERYRGVADEGAV